MEVTLYRKYKLQKYTIGKLYINGVYVCDTLEDTNRNLFQGMSKEWIQSKKVYGKTAIPFGRYCITMKVKSPKYSNRKQYEFCKGYLPRLLDVPCFDGVLIHIGNFPEDTDGCILVGKNTVKGAVMESTVTFKKLYQLLKQADDAGEEIWITIQS